jgi:hypothetical protein
MVLTDVTKARALLEEAVALADELARKDVLVGQQKAWPEYLRKALAKLSGARVNAEPTAETDELCSAC